MIYLASQSPRRKEILKAMGLRFRVVSSRYHEKTLRRLKPDELVRVHALGKVTHAKLPKRARWILGADTTVWSQGRALGKPRSRKDAEQMLKSLAGKTHQVFSGLALLDRRTCRAWIAYDRTDVTIKKLTRSEIHHYIEAVHSWDKAGAYAIQSKPKIVTRIRGSYSNVVGFPKELFRKILRSASGDSVSLSLAGS